MTRLAQALSVGCVLFGAGCTVWGPRQRELSNVPHPERERIVALTTVNGDTVSFDRSGAVLVRDTIFGMSGGQLRTIPLTQVRNVSIVQKFFSPTRTAVAVGIQLVLVFALVEALQHLTFSFGTPRSP